MTAGRRAWLATALLVSMPSAARAEVEAITGSALHFQTIDVGETPISADNPFFNSAGAPHYTAMPDSLLEAVTDAGCVWAWRRQQHTTSALTEECNAMLKPFLKSSWGAVLGVFVALVPNMDFIQPAASTPWAMAAHERKLTWTSNTTATVDMPDWPPHLGDPYPHLTLAELKDLSAKGGKVPEAYVVHALGETAFELLGGDATASDEKLLEVLTHCVELFFHIGNHAKQQDTSYEFLQDIFPSISSTLINHPAHGALYGYVKVGSWTALDRAPAGRALDLRHHPPTYPSTRASGTNGPPLPQDHARDDRGALGGHEASMRRSRRGGLRVHDELRARPRPR